MSRYCFIAADKKLTDMSNQLLIKNAQNLKMLTVETQKARDDNNIDPKALGEANRILIESLDDISRIQQEGRLTSFELRLKPTADFKAKLLSRGQWLQVVEPQALADEMVEWLRKTLERYEGKK